MIKNFVPRTFFYELTSFTIMSFCKSLHSFQKFSSTHTTLFLFRLDLNRDGRPDRRYGYGYNDGYGYDGYGYDGYNDGYGRGRLGRY